MITTIPSPHAEAPSQPALRFYGRTELARLYSPFTTDRTAWRRLQALIADTPGLADSLAREGYRSNQRRRDSYYFKSVGCFK